MSIETQQTRVWNSDFGKEYAARNTFSPDELDATYQSVFGIARTTLNQEFLADLDREARILEVGCNVGNQLLCLQRMGFSRLYGVELQPYAVEAAKARTRGINILQGSASEIPFRDRWFDLVFTSGVLIHISPTHLPGAMAEIYRCTARLIWGFEYFAPDFVQIPYRGRDDLLWKGDYALFYRKLFPDLEIVRVKRLKYLANNNEDAMFLLQRSSS